jgi:hypothetical protein
LPKTARMACILQFHRVSLKAFRVFIEGKFSDFFWILSKTECRFDYA